MLDYFQQYVRDPTTLLLFVPFFLLFLFLMSKQSTVHQDMHPQQLILLKRRRVIFVALRGLAFLCLFIALSSPFLSNVDNIQGDPKVTILIDNSSSFDLFNRVEGERIRDELQRYVDVDVAYVGAGESSPLGDAAISYMKRGGSLLLVSDGQVTDGSSLEDAALAAREINVTFNALRLEPQQVDYGVTILGPSKIAAGVEAFFEIVVRGTGEEPQRVRIYLDGDLVSEKQLFGEDKIIRMFSEPGYHILRAELDASDHFSENNLFYKTIKVIPKPVIAYLGSSDSPMLGLVHDLYQLAEGNLEGALETATAVIVNDQSSSSLSGSTQDLKTYLLEGNGLVVLGGRSSFEYGGYKDSLVEDILPVRVGSAEKTGESMQVVIVVDMSASTGTERIDRGNYQENIHDEESSARIRSLAISALGSIRNDAVVGVVAYDTGGAYKVSEMDVLLNHKKDTQARIAGLTSSIAGDAFMGDAITLAAEMLSGAGSGKNIILISDGYTSHPTEVMCKGDPNVLSCDEVCADPLSGQACDDCVIRRNERVRTCSNTIIGQINAEQGITFVTVGVGDKMDEAFMQTIASFTGGAYFPAAMIWNLNVLFGDPDRDQKDSYGIVIFNPHHFITENLDVQASVYGFNEAVPKSSAQLLVVTDTGEPLVSVWRYGLGRVVVLLTDDGTLYSGELLNKINSRLLVRMFNWAVGDPERKLEEYTTITDAYGGDSAEITVKGAAPSLDGVSFAEVERGVYRGYLPVSEPGLYTTLSALHAVNAPREYYDLGMSPSLLSAVAATNGVVFDNAEVGEMVEVFRRQSFRDVIERRSVTGVFVGAVLALLLVEILLRRLWQYKNL